jgi:hypothetical protein
MKKLPLGLSTFSEFIEKNYLYVDKTKEALELIDTYKYAFLSRPRRFGKSLFLDTLHTIFEGRKELFKDLYIYDKYEFEKHPVINISFSGDLRSAESLKRNILSSLKFNQKQLDVECDDIVDYGGCFRELIELSYKKHQKQVVVLIDEYDKPILDNLDQIDVAIENREILKAFYSILKDSDRYLRFAFLTGVSKFSKASVFSGLNNISDISLHEDYATVCGYTQNDIDTTFKEYLKDVDKAKLKEWYNGYNFLGESVYNPFNIINFIQNRCKYKNYWFESGTPTFLVKLLQKKNYSIPNLENVKVGEELANSFDIEKLSLETVLFQAGYLTIESAQESFRGYNYKLKVPNREVQMTLNSLFIDYLTDDSYYLQKQESIYEAFLTKNFESLKTTLISLFAQIPYSNFTNNKMYEYEGYYASIIYAYIASLGLEIIPEDITNIGRVDMTIKIKNYIYILEFKTTDEEPLKQIRERRYYEKYLDEKKEIVLLGITFDREKRNISAMEWEGI